MTPTGTAAANKELLRGYLEGFWNQGDPAVVERCVAENAFFHDFADSPQPLPQGLAGVKEAYRRFRVGAPNFVMIVDDMIAEGDRVAARFTIRGDHTGEFQGIPPTYRPIDFTGTTVARIVDGKIVEGWQNTDVMKLMQQLGVIPSGSALPRPLKWWIALRGQRQKRRRGL